MAEESNKELGFENQESQNTVDTQEIADISSTTQKITEDIDSALGEISNSDTNQELQKEAGEIKAEIKEGDLDLAKLLICADLCDGSKKEFRGAFSFNEDGTIKAEGDIIQIPYTINNIEDIELFISELAGKYPELYIETAEDGQGRFSYVIEEKSIDNSQNIENVTGERIAALEGIVVPKEDKEEIKERYNIYENLEPAEKENEVRSTGERFRNDLSVNEQTDLSEEKKLANEAIEALNEDLVTKEKDFLNWLENIKVDANFKPENPEKINEYLQIMSTQLLNYAKILKYDYIKAEDQKLQELINREHFTRLISIERLEKFAELAKIGIQNLSPEQTRELANEIEHHSDILKYALLAGVAGSATVGGLYYLAEAIGGLANDEIAIAALKGISASAGKTIGLEMAKIAATGAGAGALVGKFGPFALLGILLGTISVERWEKITGVRAPGWLKKKEEKK